MNFVKTKLIQGGLVFSREAVSKSLHPNDPGEFLSKLWSLFGKPDDVHYEGFTYYLKHKESGKEFTAYSGGSGPAYGGSLSQDELKPVVLELEKELHKAKLKDCEIEYDTDLGKMKIGAKKGETFEDLVS